MVDAKEIEIVYLVMRLWNSGNSYSAIARHLNGKGFKNRGGRLGSIR
jgi:hypothetical protein